MSEVSPSLRKLQRELKDLTKDPLDGVVLDVDEDNIYKWNVGLFGPPDTPFSGGYFKATLDFPKTYPFNPPKMKFVSRVFHPNVYPSGAICISILHPPGNDDMSGERPEERWNPTQTVRTILLSVISLLNEPNTSSPANVDANVAYLKYLRKEGDEYLKRVEHDVEISRRTAEDEGLKIPVTMDDYVSRSNPLDRMESVMSAEDFADSDDDSEGYDFDHAGTDDDDDDEEEEEDEEGDADGQDAGLDTAED